MAGWTDRDPEVRNAQRWTAEGVARAAKAAEPTPPKTKKKSGAKKKG